MDLQLVIAIREAFDPNCIVEVASSLSIDGDNIEIPKVAPFADLIGGHFGSITPRLVNHGVREMMRNMKFPNDDLDVDAKIVRPAQRLDHTADWTLIPVLGKVH